MPADPLAGEKYHLLGIAGRGMAPVAIAAQFLGAEVTGCDLKAREDSQRYLTGAGIAIEPGHSVDHVRPGETVVATSVASSDEPELLVAQERGQVWHRTDLLARVLRGRPGAGITGSHGKGTVTALTAAALDEAGLDPLAIIGVPVPELGGITRLGAGPTVAEVDDSDLTLRGVVTDVAAVTNLDEDHPHLAIPLRRVTEAVGEFVSRARRTVVLGPSPRAAQLETYATAEVWRYGRDFAARTLEAGGGHTRVSLRGPGGVREEATLRLLGPQTAQNAAVAFATALALGADPAAAAAGLGRVDRIVRRMEPVGSHNGVRVFDDFGGKHPINVRLGLATLRRHFPDSRITAVFEPYGPYLSQWGYRYAKALGGADHVVFAPPVYLAYYDEGRRVGPEWMHSCQTSWEFAEGRGAAVSAAERSSRPGDLIVFFVQLHQGAVMAQAAATGVPVIE
ncbi:Mur ligase domain-containing protein [Nocardioides sp.]|uniref:Mur ligase domain-containing protein n=1 Tax=Nocardioides sp. TaxID=35761 RepID=UPI003567C14B